VKKRRQLTVAGISILGATVLTAIFGLNTEITTIYQLFALLSSLFGAAFVISYTFRGSFTIKRTLPEYASVGQKVSYKIEITNNTTKLQSDLLLQEEHAVNCPTLHEFKTSTEPGEEKRNMWDRKVLYHRFSWLASRKANALFKEHAIPVIAPKSYINLTAGIEPFRRGYIELCEVIIKRPGPFNFFKAYKRIPSANRLLVLPKRYPVSNLNLQGTRRHHSGGVANASSVGNTDEFMSLRDYQMGDPMRNIHWKSYAKTGSLIVRENEDEYFVRHALILDTFSIDQHTEIFEAAVSVAASFVASIGTQESLLDLMFVEDKAHCFSTGRGVDHTSKMLEILACLETCADKPFDSLTPSVLEHSPLLSGCICVLLEWDKQRRELIQKLQAVGVPVVVIVLYENHISGEFDESAHLFENLHFVDIHNLEEALVTL